MMIQNDAHMPLSFGQKTLKTFRDYLCYEKKKIPIFTDRLLLFFFSLSLSLSLSLFHFNVSVYCILLCRHDGVIY